MKLIFLTIDGNHAAALQTAAERIRREHGLALTIRCYDAAGLRMAGGMDRLQSDLTTADFVFGARLFGEDLVRPLERMLTALTCPVLIITSNPALIRQTRVGRFSLAQHEEGEGGLLRQWVKKLRPQGGAGEARRQLAVLRNLSKVLRLIPGKAHDLYTYIVSHQYWLNSSPENLYRFICVLISGYVSPKAKLPALDPISYPETALFHPSVAEPFESLEAYAESRAQQVGARKKTARTARRPSADAPFALLRSAFPGGSVGILALRSVALSGNTAHLDALVEALEAQGIEARMAYASGLDARPAIETFFRNPDGSAAVDLLINATGFALVGGPAESRPIDARAALEQLDIGYLGLIPLSFQRVEDWRSDDSGLAPIQSALSVAVPELEGAADPLVYGGSTHAGDAFVGLPGEIAQIVERVVQRVALRRKANAEKRLAVVIYSFPPNLGNIGTAAYLDVFASLYELLQALAADGYTVTIPPDVETLRQMVIGGNAQMQGTDANVVDRLPIADYMRQFPQYSAIEPFWGRAPGDLLNDGKQFYILGCRLGNLIVGVQPSFGYERDPMRLLMAKDAAPNHAFAAFYTYLRRNFAADALIHLGTHGALEFMPGKQVGLSADCWPVRLLGGLPNFYFYSVNNPSEAAIAKRRGGATLVSYLVPPLQQAGLYKGLRALKDSLDRYRQQPEAALLEDIQLQAEKLGMQHVQAAGQSDDHYLAHLGHELLQIEQRMIPAGLHVLGRPPLPVEQVDFLALAAAFRPARDRNGGLLSLPTVVAAALGYDFAALRDRLNSDSAAQAAYQQVDQIIRSAIGQFVADGPAAADRYLSETIGLRAGTLGPVWTQMGELLRGLISDNELAGVLRGLRGGFIPPSPANDVVRDPAVLPTGRNVYSLDPYRVPSPTAMERGRALAAELLGRGEQMPQSIAVVLWGSDNLKSECEGVAQVLALIGARPLIDELGSVSDVELVPLSELGRPRIDVLVTVSGIFRDLLGNQIGLIDRAARLAAAADEAPEQNYLRRNALEQAATLGISVEEAAARVFANAPGSYGANVNHLVDSGTWDEETQLSDAFLSRKSFTLGASGEWRDSRALMERALSKVDLTFQNVDSFEVGLSDIDNYYESLGGLTKSVELLRGERPPVLVADAVAPAGRVSSLEQAVRLESRAKLLNPKWYEAMLAHGYEGAREIEARVNNTYGWSATAGAVDGWVYQGVAETYMLDDAMRERLAALNPHAAVGVVRRLLEANGRGHWDAEEATLEQLRMIYADLEDRLEGVMVGS